MFNYNHLYYFYMTAKLGGVVRAAKSLRIAQPSLTAQIRALEGKLNLRLFFKDGRRIALTPDGERAYGFCKKIFEAAEEFSDHLRSSGANKGVRCRIGVSREIERPFVSDVLTTLLRKKQFQVKPMLTLTSNEHGILLESMRSGELDCIITNVPVYAQDVLTTVELSMPVVAVAAPSYIETLVGKKKGSTAWKIKEYKLDLVLPTDQLRLRIESDIWLQRHKIRNFVIFESDMLAVVVRAVIEKVGVAFLPQPYIARELNCEALIHVGDCAALWRHNIYIVTRKVKHVDPIVNHLREYFLQLGGK